MDITIRNKKGESLDLGHTFPICLTKFKPLSTSYKINKADSMSGAVFISSHENSRKFELHFALSGESEEDLRVLKHNIQKIISPKVGLFYIDKKTPTSCYTIEVTPLASVNYTDINAIASEGKLILEAPEPYWRNKDKKYYNLNNFINNTFFPINFESNSNNIVNLLDGTDFTKSNLFKLHNSGDEMTRSESKGTLTYRNVRGKLNGIESTYSNQLLQRDTDYTFTITAKASTPLEIYIINEDDSMGVEDGFSYGWNCTTVKENFMARDSMGEYIGEMIPIGSKLCVLWADFTKKLLQVQYLKNGVAKNCYITNDPNCLEYRYKDAFTNASGGQLDLFFGDGVKAGYLDAGEKATVLYKYEGRYCLIYNSGVNVLAKTATTTYEGARGFLNEKVGTLNFSANTEGRKSITFRPQRQHKKARIMLGTRSIGATYTISQPKLSKGTSTGVWSASPQDDPRTSSGLELGVKDLAAYKNVYNAGENNAQPTLTFTFGGLCSGVGLLNSSTNKSIKLNGAFNNGEILEIDLQTKKVKFTNSEGKETADYSKIDVLNDWDFTIREGDNNIKITAEAGGENISASLEYWEEFMEV